MLRTLALTATAMLAFATNSILCRQALAQTSIDAASFTLVRLAAGAAMLCLLVLMSRRSPGLGGSWRGAVALQAYAGCFSFAYVSLAAGTGALLLFGAVQATMILRGLAAGERLGWMQWGGFCAAMLGLVVLVAPGVAAPDPLGATLMVAAGIAWGVYSLLGRGGGDPLRATAGNFLRATPLALPLLALPQVISLDAAGVFYGVLSGAVASALGYIIWYAALPGLSATRAATVQLSVPVITAIAGVLLLGEAVSVRLVVASVAVLGGIALVVQGRLRTVGR